FSLDGATPESYETIRLRGNFARIIGNYKALAERFRRGETRQGAIIRVLTVLQKTNLYDHRPMFHLLREMELLDRYSLVPVFDYAPDPTSLHPQIPSPRELTHFQHRIEQDIREAASPEEGHFYRQWRDSAALWQVPHDVLPKPDTGLSCVVPWYNTYVDAKGRVYPCCYLVNTQHVMGHLDQDSFTGIWHGPAYEDFRRRVALDRSRLTGCATCPRNDRGLLRQLRWIRPFSRNNFALTPHEPQG
ncbi:MAG: SPASM domain-containing protein, partial [Magnetococcales bacterium]|nr:SPASM domain-containing protein [Magnetococcales bacterium]